MTVSGLVIAGIGFFLTRFTVQNSPMNFLLTGLLPLVLGLGLAAFGVALSVGMLPPRFVRTVTLWTLVGTGAMTVLLFSTIAGSAGMSPTQLEAGPLLSNFPIGGAVGGAMVGVYAARNRVQRNTLQQQANWLATLNRILRDQVLNSVNAIKGHASILEEGVDSSSVEVITRQSHAIEDSIEEVGSLTRTGADQPNVHPVTLESAVEAAIDNVGEEFPNIDFEVIIHDAVPVYANERLITVFSHLLDNAARDTETENPKITIEAEAKPRSVIICVRDNGPGLPERERETLESGSITEYDNPRSGFGLNIVRLLVESYGGAIRTTVDDGTEVEIELARGDQKLSLSRGGQGNLGTYGVPSGHLAIAVVSALLAGGVMGLVMQSMVGIVPVIEALYGVAEPLIGWMTHEFHSVVFGMIYATLLTVVPQRTQSLQSRLAIALGFATFLWLFAAGIVMPVWLQLLGLSASLPNLTGAALAGHAVWGVTPGLLYHVLRSRLELPDSLF